MRDRGGALQSSNSCLKRPYFSSVKYITQYKYKSVLFFIKRAGFDRSAKDFWVKSLQCIGGRSTVWPGCCKI